MAESSQQKLTRIRPPRVKITYDVETGGAMEKQELPFIVGIFADLAGDPDPEVAPTAMKLRRMVDIDRDVFNDVMRTIGPRVDLGPILKADHDANTLGALHTAGIGELRFNALEDFDPLPLVMALPPLKADYLARAHLRSLQAKAESNDDITAHLDQWVQGEPGSETLQHSRQAELIKALATGVAADAKPALRKAVFALQTALLDYQSHRPSLPGSDSQADKDMREKFKPLSVAMVANSQAQATLAQAIAVCDSMSAAASAADAKLNLAKSAADKAAELLNADNADGKAAAQTAKEAADKAVTLATTEQGSAAAAKTSADTGKTTATTAADETAGKLTSATTALAGETTPAAEAMRAWLGVVTAATGWVMLGSALGAMDVGKPADVAMFNNAVDGAIGLLDEMSANDTQPNRDRVAALLASIGANGTAPEVLALGAPALSPEVQALQDVQASRAAAAGSVPLRMSLLLLGMSDAATDSPLAASYADDDARALCEVREWTMGLIAYLHQSANPERTWTATQVFGLLSLLGVSNEVTAAKAILRLHHFADQVLNRLQQGDTAMLHLLKKGANALIDETVASIDQALSHALSTLMHAPNFMAIEATWRGLHYLVSNTSTSTMLRLRVFNATLDDLRRDMEKAVEFDQSALFKLIYEAEYGSFGGYPYSLLVGGYEIAGGSADIEFLKKISEVAAAAHAPFIAAASSRLFGLPSYDRLDKPRDLAKIFDGPELISWQAFRETDDARYVSLVLPRALMRLPYGKPDKRYTQQCEGLNFDEDMAADGAAVQRAADGSVQSYPAPSGKNFLWGNAAYLLAERITNAFSLYSWTAAIRGVEGGGLVEGLPVYSYTSDTGSTDLFCPLDVAITDRREKELNDLGFISLCHCKGTSKAAFFGGQTTNLPKKYFSDSANANAKISAMLPYMLAASRFAHYIKVIMRDKVGSFMTRGNVEIFLNGWIANYVLLDDNASQDQKSAYPLRDASVIVTEVPGATGTYKATVFLKPHFQLEELTTSIRLVAKLPG